MRYCWKDQPQNSGRTESTNNNLVNETVRGLKDCFPVRLALPKSHPHADKPEIPISLLKEEPFIGLNRMYPNYGDWLLKVCRRVGFKPRIVKEADGFVDPTGCWGLRRTQMVSTRMEL